ncbi:putative transposase [Neisseria meningitidis 2001072]|nr:putative transposase [Neisseria meningitidis 2001072]EOC44124.1 putative transposase [Neisseria meningitidis 2005079]
MKITHCKLKKKVQKELLRFFVLEVTARSAADILGIHPNSADCSTVKSARLSTIIWPWLPMRFLRALSSRTKAISADGVKADVVAVRRKSGCFRHSETQRRVYTVVVDNAKSETLLPVIKKKIMPDSIVYTNSLSSCDKLDVSGFIHYRINHSKEFADRQNHINGIENFWNQAKRVLRKYNGIDRKSFPLFLKECEFRFNFGTPSQQLKILRDWCGI